MKLLFVNSCLREEKSRTLRLARLYIEQFLEKEGRSGRDWEVKEINLSREWIQVQGRELLEKRENLIKRGEFQDEVFDYAKEFISADFVVMAAPYWDWQFPALLKIYLERCSVAGLTYTFDEKGIPHGRCQGEKLVYITTAGGNMNGLNFGYEYVQGLMKIFGIEETEFICAEGLDLEWNDWEEIIAQTERDIVDRFK